MVKLDSAKNNNTQTEQYSDLNKFAQSVLNQLIQDNIPTTPDNFDAYFQKMLEEKPSNLQKKISELTEFNKVDYSEQQAYMEKEIKQGFAHIKNMLQTITIVYKNLVIMKNLSQKRLNELAQSGNMLATQSVIKSFIEELSRLNQLMDRHLDIVKTSYEEVGKIFKSVEENSIYDTKFGVYNKNYFMRSIKIEMDGISRYGYNVSIMTIKLKDEILDEISSLKDKNSILRNIAKLLLKTSRRSDLVSHYEDGCFIMLMRHTNLESAKKACERISSMLYQTAFFIGENEIEIDLEISTTELNDKFSIEELISRCLDGLPKSGKNIKIYEAVEN